jgi:serine/threonine-protein kinase
LAGDQINIGPVAELKSISHDFRYEIVRKIYEGGMGIVYEAQQHGSRGFVKRVAIKVVRERYNNNLEFIENFVGEAKLVADLIHTNIVQTYHLGEFQGTAFICMELIRGVNLEQFLHRLADAKRTLPQELAVFIVSRIARGLAYAHSKTDADGHVLGIVHRDINPKNIMIAWEGDVKVTDFGVAKARGFLTDKEGEEVAGKPEYMSPEQADFQITDKRSDLFSAGIVLSQLLTGKNLFKALTPEDSRQRVLNAEIPDFTQAGMEIPARLNEILQRALSRDLANRYQTAEEMLFELEHFIYHKGYGPTNETLGKFIRDLFQDELSPKKRAPRSGTMKLNSTIKTNRTTKTSKIGTSQTGRTSRTTSKTIKTRKSSLIERLKSKFK